MKGLIVGLMIGSSSLVLADVNQEWSLVLNAIIAIASAILGGGFENRRQKRKRDREQLNGRK